MLRRIDEKLLRPLPPTLRELMLYAYGMAWCIAIVAILVNANLFWSNGREDLIPITIVVVIGLVLLTVLEALGAVILRFILPKRASVTTEEGSAL